MENEKLKFRWVQIAEWYWYCPRFRLTVDKDVITGRWRTQWHTQGNVAYDSAAEARAVAEQQYILKCQESNKVLTSKLITEGKKR